MRGGPPHSGPPHSGPPHSGPPKDYYPHQGATSESLRPVVTVSGQGLPPQAIVPSYVAAQTHRGPKAEGAPPHNQGAPPHNQGAPPHNQGASSRGPDPRYYQQHPGSNPPHSGIYAGHPPSSPHGPPHSPAKQAKYMDQPVPAIHASHRPAGYEGSLPRATLGMHAGLDHSKTQQDDYNNRDKQPSADSRQPLPRQHTSSCAGEQPLDLSIKPSPAHSKDVRSHDGRSHGQETLRMHGQDGGREGEGGRDQEVVMRAQAPPGYSGHYSSQR